MTSLRWSRGLLWLIAGAALVAVLSLVVRADDGGVGPPPPKPSPQAAVKASPYVGPVQQYDLRPIQQPHEAELAPPTTPAAPTSAVIHIAVPPAAPAPPQTIQLHVTTSGASATTAPPAPAPAPVAAELRPAGPMRRAIGALGDRLARVGYDHVVVPPASKPTPQAVVVYQVQAPPAPAPQPVMASPQAPASGIRSLLFRR